jgi:hypothetical protein
VHFCGTWRQDDQRRAEPPGLHYEMTKKTFPRFVPLQPWPRMNGNFCQGRCQEWFGPEMSLPERRKVDGAAQAAPLQNNCETSSSGLRKDSLATHFGPSGKAAIQDRAVVAAAEESVCKLLFCPFGAGPFPICHPRLAPWAVSLRRFAAKICPLVPFDFQIRSSHKDSESLPDPKSIA